MRAFTYCGDASELQRGLVVGALVPSRDEAGRLFPMCAAAPVVLTRELVTYPDLLPLLCEPLWQVAGACLEALVSDSSLDVSTAFEDLRQPSAVPLAEAEATYRSWCETLSIAELAALITESGEIVDFCGILRRLSSSLGSLGSVAARAGLRFPLGAAGGAAVCFWLDVVRRFLEKTSVPSVFWSNDGAADRLTLHLGPPPSEALSDLWLPGSFEGFTNFAVPLSVSDTRATEPLPSIVERSLRDPRCSVATLLAAISSS